MNVVVCVVHYNMRAVNMRGMRVVQDIYVMDK